MDLVLSFDDTGSMSSIRHEVRRKLQDLTTTLFNVIPNIRIGIVIHNDYCDGIHCLRYQDLTPEKEKVIAFINTPAHSGGEGPYACYENVLQHVNETFSWESDQKVLVLIGDEPPHVVGYKTFRRDNRQPISTNINWKDELQKLVTKNIIIYPIQCLGKKYASFFYKELAASTKGKHLTLAQFSHTPEYITAIAYSQANRLNEYEESSPTFKTNLAFRNMFDNLRGRAANIATLGKVDIMGRFQVMDVPVRTRINDFVNQQGIQYIKGRGFYNLVKKETVQGYKEIILIDKITGETIPSQQEARQLLGLPLSGNMDINPRYISACQKYNVYIQSTSYTRQLDAGTQFLYEADLT